jgi:hypothetical protein
MPPTEHATLFEELYGPMPLRFLRGPFPLRWGTPPADEEARARWVRTHAQLEHGYRNPRYLVEMLDAQVINENRLRRLELLAKAWGP